MLKKYYLLQNIHTKEYANILDDNLVWNSIEENALKFESKQDIFDIIEKYNFALLDTNIVEREEKEMKTKENIEIEKSEIINNNNEIKNNEELHPERYGGDTPYECKKVLEEWFKDNSHINGYESWLLGTLIKYCNRFGKKDDKLKEAKKIEVYAKFLREFEEKN